MLLHRLDVLQLLLDGVGLVLGPRPEARGRGRRSRNGRRFGGARGGRRGVSGGDGWPLESGGRTLLLLLGRELLLVRDGREVRLQASATLVLRDLQPLLGGR